jgi:transposase
VDDVEKYCPDGLWQLARPLLPAPPERHQGGGRRRTDDRAVLAAILYVLESGCSWRKLPGSVPVHWRTAHCRFAEWVAAGVMTARHQAVLDVLGAAGAIDWSRASIDSMHVRAVKGPGPARSTPGKPGSKIHAMSERGGLPLHVDLSAANLNDHLLFEDMVDGIIPVRQRPGGRPRKRPGKLHGDKGYDYPACRLVLTDDPDRYVCSVRLVNPVCSACLGRWREGGQSLPEPGGHSLARIDCLKARQSRLVKTKSRHGRGLAASGVASAVPPTAALSVTEVTSETGRQGSEVSAEFVFGPAHLGDLVWCHGDLGDLHRREAARVEALQDLVGADILYLSH